MKRASGTIRDIRTGRAIAKTNSITAVFLEYVLELIHTQVPFYLVHGRCRHLEMRYCVDEFVGMELSVLYDPRMPSDTVFVFEGTADEWEQIA